MDEPLSNLDAKLRVQMRTEVSRLQQRLGTTTIYVTHDQTEALTLGDRVAVMRSGVLQQVASPMDLYSSPVNLFVAGFIGSPAMNFMPATVDGDTVKLPFGDVRLPSEMHGRVKGAEGRQLIGASGPSTSRTPRWWASCATAARPSARISTCSSRSAPSCTRTSRCPRTRRSSPRSCASSLRTPAGGEIPMEGDEGSIVARLDPGSDVKQGKELEL